MPSISVFYRACGTRQWNPNRRQSLAMTTPRCKTRNVSGYENSGSRVCDENTQLYKSRSVGLQHYRVEIRRYQVKDRRCRRGKPNVGKTGKACCQKGREPSHVLIILAIDAKQDRAVSPPKKICNAVSPSVLGVPPLAGWTNRFSWEHLVLPYMPLQGYQYRNPEQFEKFRAKTV